MTADLPSYSSFIHFLIPPSQANSCNFKELKFIQEWLTFLKSYQGKNYQYTPKFTPTHNINNLLQNLYKWITGAKTLQYTQHMFTSTPARSLPGCTNPTANSPSCFYGVGMYYKKLDIAMNRDFFSMCGSCLVGRLYSGGSAVPSRIWQDRQV